MYKKVSEDLAVRPGYNPGPVNAYNALGHPKVRLAFGNSPPERNGSSGLESPSVRLGITIDGGGSVGPNQMAKHLGPPDVRLAATNAMLSDGGNNGVKYRYPHAKDRKDQEAPLLLPALLVSYYYLEPFLKNRHRYVYRDWAMDSGAFSAKNSGKEVNLQSYIDACKQLLDEDPTLVEIFALDVIGDGKASIKNCEEMWRQGIEAIPCWHQGEPWDVLVGVAKDYPKVALGGLVGTIAKQKRKTIEQAFARIWPKAIHGFGLCTEDLVLNFPFHSVDATSWEMGPCAFGRWNAFGQMSVRGSKQNLRAEVEWHLKLEQNARRRWKREMELLKYTGPVIRLADQAGARMEAKAKALGQQ